MKSLKKLLCLVFMCVVSLSVTVLSGCKKYDYTIGVCQLLPHPALDQATKGFKDAVNAKMKEAGKTVKIDIQNAQGEANICPTIVNKFVSLNYNLIMANATPALQSAAAATTTIPVLGTSITEYGVALSIDNFTGVTGYNVSGTSDLASLEDQANMFNAFLGTTVSNIGILYCSSEANSKYQVDVVEGILEDQGYNVERYTFSDSNDVETVARQCLTASDAVYIPTDNTCASCAEIIGEIVYELNKPVIAGEEGLCTGCKGIATISISYYNIGYKTGEMACDILLNGADIKTMAIAYDEEPKKKYNEEMCTRLSITVPQGYTKLGE